MRWRVVIFLLPLNEHAYKAIKQIGYFYTICLIDVHLLRNPKPKRCQRQLWQQFLEFFRIAHRLGFGTKPNIEI